MQEIALLTTFAAASVALVCMPGPDMVLIASRSASQGRASGFACLAGIQCGTYLHALAAAIGLSQLFLAIPTAYDAVRLAGAGYLLYLAWNTVRADPFTFAPSATLAGASIWSIFWQGLLTNLLNPKMVLFVVALFPQFLQPEHGTVIAQMLILATIINIVGLAVNGTVILGIAAMRRRFSTSRQLSRWPQYLLGSVFAGLAMRLAFDGRR